MTGTVSGPSPGPAGEVLPPRTERVTPVTHPVVLPDALHQILAEDLSAPQEVRGRELGREDFRPEPPARARPVTQAPRLLVSDASRHAQNHAVSLAGKPRLGHA